MKKEFDFGYMLEIYEKGNYGTVKKKHFVDMLELVTFTDKKSGASNIDYNIVLTANTDNICLYDGCIHIFNKRVNMLLEENIYLVANSLNKN